MQDKHLPLTFAPSQLVQPKSSGLQTRFSDSAHQFSMTHQKSQRQIQMNAIITGHTDDVVVPRPGEFLLVSQLQHSKPGAKDALNREELEKIMRASSVSGKSISSQKMRRKLTPKRQQTAGQNFEDDLVLQGKRPEEAVLLQQLRTELTTDVRQITRTVSEAHLLTQSSRFLQKPMKSGILDPEPSHELSSSKLKSRLKPSASVTLLPNLKQSRCSSVQLLTDAAESKLLTERLQLDIHKVKRSSHNSSNKVAHSYRVNSNSNSIRHFLRKPTEKVPQIVQLQRQLKRENSKVSPFLISDERVITPSPSLPLLQKTSSRFLQRPDSDRAAPKTQPEQVQKPYLTLEVYDPLYGEEDFASLISKYACPRTGETRALSQWLLDDGTSELRECLVVNYLTREEQFEIEWLANKHRKRVSRFNLRFLREDKIAFQKRYNFALEHRTAGQLLLKYFMLQQEVDLSKEVVVGAVGARVEPRLLDEIKTKISYRIFSFNSFREFLVCTKFKEPIEYLQRSAEGRYDIKFLDFYMKYKTLDASDVLSQIARDLKSKRADLQLLSLLFKEVDRDFIRAHKALVFDLQLPYSGNKYKEIAPVLPQSKFTPVQQRIFATHPIVPIPTRSQSFLPLLQAQTRSLIIADAKKLRIVQLSQRHLSDIPNQSFLCQDFAQPLLLEQFRDANLACGAEIRKLFTNHVRDVEFEVAQIIAEEVQANAKLNEETYNAITYNKHEFKPTPISQRFKSEIFKLQKVLQMRSEQAARQMFLNSTKKYTDYLGTIVDFLQDSIGKPFTELQLGDLMTLSRSAVLECRMKKNRIFQIKAKLKIVDKQILFDPPVSQWTPTLVDYINGFLESVQNLPCFSVDNQIAPPVHAEGGSKIFLETESIAIEEIERLRTAFDTIMNLPRGLLRECGQFEKLLQTDLSEFKKFHKKANFAVSLYEKLIEEGIALNERANQLFFEATLLLGPFQIECRSVRQKINKKTSELQSVLFEAIKKKIEQTNTQIEAEVEGVLKIILEQKTYRDIEHVTETKKYITNLPTKMLEIRALIKDAMSKMTLLERYQCCLEEKEMENTWLSLSKPLLIFESQGDCIELLEQFYDKFYVELRQTQVALAQEIGAIAQELELIIAYESLQSYEEAVNKCDSLMDRIDSAINTAAVVNRREILYNQGTTDYSQLFELKKKFKPFNQLWNYSREYFYKQNLWVNGAIGDLDRDRMPADINAAIKGLVKLAKTDLRVSAGMAILIAGELKDLFLEVKPFLPLIVALKNPDLQPRHWEIINKLSAHVHIDSDLHHSITELMSLNIMDILEDIASVSDIATKEKQLELQLNKMRHEWASVKFQFAEYEGTVTIQGLQPIWDMLDEQIQKTIIIAGSPYVKYLAQDVSYWKNHLVKMQEVLEEWSKAQRGWLYLFPIFNATDIQKQLEDVANTFASVDKMWRAIMLQTQGQPQVIEATNQLKLFENLAYCNATMDKVQKLLNQYLHEKQLLFPRFFFLSNDDLLHILSQTKEPLRVQEHMNKCFEGIRMLKFVDTSSFPRALGMSSELGEYVEFCGEVDPFVREMNSAKVRAVEEWLTDVEWQMRESLRMTMVRAGAAFYSIAKEDWIAAFAQQVILVNDQLQWTHSIESALSNPESLRRAFLNEEAKLQELVSIIYRKAKVADPVTMTTLNSLIVLDVHTKDVTASLLQKPGGITKHDFEWQSQMRHYSSNSGSAEVFLSMMDSTRSYGYEYLGNQTRLVITPLTDRCYRTLMGALKLNLGGAPEGPAGTGKTETTKDLAKAVAKQCLVFNCSDQLEVETMGKFFKGLACCGAWACFDEFNRIELEVLSVIAAQILTIQTALMRRKPNAMFNFEDEMILLNGQCAIFITMNPGYAGRSELPDNLKALFRPVAMMVPMYAMIAEISLYSYGFQNARELSIKITQSLKLSSEQLSTQSHYDYGMRTVKSIILAAGVYKTEQPHENEHKLVLKAICDCNLPKFITEDQQLFAGIIDDLFPDTDKDQQGSEVLLKALKQGIAQRNLDQNFYFESKAIQLFDTIRVRHGLMLVGSAMAGKSEVAETLAVALTSMDDKVCIFKINPKAVSIGRLYGDFEKLTRDWQDGILSRTVREATEKQERSWIVLDGPVDAIWIENLNTVLDDNKKLCLISGEIIKYTPKMTMMFEVEDLAEASPATVSRCGMVYLSTDQLGWECLINPWIAQLSPDLKANKIDEFYADLLGYFLPKVTDFLFGADKSLEEEVRTSSLKPMIPNSKNQQVRSFLNILESLLKLSEADNKSLEALPEENLMEEQLAGKPLKKEKTAVNYYDLIEPRKLNHVLQLVLVALTWGFGAPLPLNVRRSLSDFIWLCSDEIQSSTLVVKKRLDCNLLPPQDANLFDLCYVKTPSSKDLWQWTSIDHNIEGYNLKGNLKQENAKQDDSLVDLAALEYDSQGPKNSSEDELEFTSIFVMTKETLKQRFYLETLIRAQCNVLILGDTGTGKTSAVKKFMHQLVQAGGWEVGETVLSATTSAIQLQSYFDSTLEKHKKGVFGPKNPLNQLLLFVDDLNMPAKEKYGAQPPLEIIRQWTDMKGCFNQANEWYTVMQQLFVSAMQMPGGGRSLPSQRLMRHFNVIYVPQFDHATLTKIFGTILEWGFVSHCDEWKRQIKNITSQTIELFQRAIKTLLPLPGKSHYRFNLRQVSEMVQGILLVPSDCVEKTQDKYQLLAKLWVHEALRVFSDRLVSAEDKSQFVESCLQPADFKHEDPQSLIFCNFIDPSTTVYQEVFDATFIQMQTQKVIDAYNQGRFADQKINIFVFDYVVQHMARISRILKKPILGNGLLIGLGDNGRRTITKLAAFVNDFSVFKIEPFKQYGLPEWQEDLKSLFKSMGLDNKTQVFLLSDEDLRQEHQIEDVNNILNVGEVIGLFNSEDIEEINYEMDKQMRAQRIKGSPFSVFMQRCKQNLHVIMSLSPAGNHLQTLFRKYPSLVNCASIDWFLSWPSTALLSVSQSYLQNHSQTLFSMQEEASQYYIASTQVQQQVRIQPLEEITEMESFDDIGSQKPIFSPPFGSSRSGEGGSSVDYHSEEHSEDSLTLDNCSVKNLEQIDTPERVSRAFVDMHQAMSKCAEQYFLEKRRRVYVTSSNFLKIFDKFIKLVQEKSAKIQIEVLKFEQGIANLDSAKLTIDEMQDKLTALNPVLDQKSKQVDQTMMRLSVESKEVQRMQGIVDQEANIVEEQKKAAELIKVACQEKLDEAMPHFEKAIKALKTLSNNDFVILKALKNPPDGVRLALEACCIMLGVGPDYVKQGSKKVADFWEKSKTLIKDYKKLIQRLENYNKDNISPQVIKKIQPYIESPQFNPDIIRNASNAAEGICKWVIALVKYDAVYKEITPKREALAEAEKQLAVVLEKLRLKQDELQGYVDQNQSLQQDLQSQVAEKQALLNQRDESQKKLKRASQLMSSIGSERDRWLQSIQKLKRDKVTLLGDIMLSTCFLVYLSMFEGSFRIKMHQEKWTRILDFYGIKFSQQSSIRTVICSEEQIASWLLKGLPGDSTSIENMIIIEQSRRTPVFIDPQCQALKFFRKLWQEQDEDLVVVKINQPNALKVLETCIQSGSTVIVLNCGDVTHNALVSIVKNETVLINDLCYMRFNDDQIQCDARFKALIFSQFENPNLSPVLQQAATVLNFCVTSEGLEEQLLRTIGKHEQAKEEVEREKLAKQNFEFNKQRREIMDQILEVLRSQGSEILESDDFVIMMDESRKITTDIVSKLQASKHIEDRLDENQRILRPLANQASKLFFVTQNLSSLDHMYQFSMSWFTALFETIFAEETAQDPGEATTKRKRKVGPGNDAKHAKEVKQQRVRFLQKKLRESLYRQVQQSLFEHHKLLFAFYIAIKLNEPQQTSNDDFNAKLKALDKMMASQKRTSQMQSSFRGSVIQSQANRLSSDATLQLGGQKSVSHQHQIPRKTEQKQSQRNSMSRVSMSQGGDESAFGMTLNPQQNLKEEERVKIDPEMLKFLLTGLVSKEMQPYSDLDNPCPEVFSAEMWKQLKQLTSFDLFESIQEDISNNLEQWQRFMKLQNIELLPEPYLSMLPHFCFIPLVRILKPELTVQSIRRYIKKSLGQYFITPQITYMRDVYEMADYQTPILVILTPGNDPMDSIKKLGEEKQKIPYPVSLGKGQGGKAKFHIEEMRKAGGWIVLQNCHLGSSFLPELEQIVENLANLPDEELENNTRKGYEPTHPDFRMFLTSASIDYFPLTVLQKSIKVTSEPPKGIKTSLVQTYTQITQDKRVMEQFDSYSKQEIWQPLFFSLSFFHAIVRERRRYGQLGWNLPSYDFNESDFKISQRQLQNMVAENESVPFEALRYLCGECNYGGRVTDDRDRRTLITLIQDFYNPQVLSEEKYLIVQRADAQEYQIAKLSSAKDYLALVSQLPENEEESPYLVGLHQNANIIQQKQEANHIFKCVLQMTKSDSGPNKTSQTQLKQLLTEVEKHLKEPFKIKEVERKYPFSYKDSMNGVLLQELVRYNRLLTVISSSVKMIHQALDGLTQTTAEVESLAACILSNTVPPSWLAKSYPSRKTLLGYIDDLEKRLSMLERWIAKGQPQVFWLSGFYFTHSFLAGIKQNYARANRLPYDRVEFKFSVCKRAQEDQIRQNGFQGGCLIEGLYLEGSGWDDAHGVLCESVLKEIHILMPLIVLEPILDKGACSADFYECPTYVTSARAGTLSTTGHSTNFIMTVELPCRPAGQSEDNAVQSQPPSHWVKRSVALLSQLDS